MKVALCCIGRMENRYIKEYVEYYKNIGVDKIFIYDNNYDGEEYFEDVIGDFIDSNFVQIINFRDREVCQLIAYQDCYEKNKNDYDWICFFDIDEYLTFKRNDINVKDFLSQDIFREFDMLHINWMVYGDNDLVKYEDKPLVERFKKPIEPLDFKFNYNFPENNHIKSIVRGGLKDVRWNKTPHTPSGVSKCCDANGNFCNPDSPFNQYDFSTVWLRHYQTKTIEEWIDIKTKRGFPGGNKDYFKKHDVINDFFKRNKLTEEKNEYIKERFAPISNDLDIFICTHKDFNKIVSNQAYKTINMKKIDNKKLGLKYCDDFYCELLAYIWIVKNYSIKKYIGFCHYRRYFSFLDDIPNLDEVFKSSDVILPKPLKLKNTVREHYAYCHNVEDLDIVRNIVKEWFPDYLNAVDVTFGGKILFTNNMFIMKREDFLEFMSFYMNVIDRYLAYIENDVDYRIDTNKDKYLKNLKNSPQNGEHWYQKRIGGFMAERLLTAFIVKKFKKIKLYNIELTEKKYNVDKINEKYEK